MNAHLARVEAILARLAERAAALGLEGLAPQERSALLAYSAHGLVARGGLRQFFEGSIPLSELVAAFRDLKLRAVANAALASASLFPDPALADDPQLRREHLAGINTDKHDYAFFRLSSEELLSAIASLWQRIGPPSSV